MRNKYDALVQVQPVAVLRREAQGLITDVHGTLVEVPENRCLRKEGVRTFRGLVPARKTMKLGAGMRHGNTFVPLDSRAIRVGGNIHLVPELLVYLSFGFGKNHSAQVVVPFGEPIEGYLTKELTVLLGEWETPLAEVLATSVILR